MGTRRILSGWGGVVLVIQPIESTTPVILLTGARGAGKSTALNAALRRAPKGDIAVVFSEEGATPIRHDLVEWSSERRQALAVGCVCCAARSDPADTFRRLDLLRVRGSIANFRRVVFETSGESDPAAIVTGLFGDPMVAARYRLEGIIAVASAGDDHPLTAKRIAMADRVLAPGAEVPVDVLDVSDRGEAPVAPPPWIRRVVTASGPVDPEAFTAWLAALAKRHGAVVPRVVARLDAGASGTLLARSTQHLVHPSLRLAARETGSRLELITRDVDPAELLGAGFPGGAPSAGDG